MPVTISTASHASRIWEGQKAASVADLLRGADQTYQSNEEILQSSLSKQLQETHITPSGNGLVWAAYHAYSTHHHLIIRPEDVWFAIISQLGFYINAHAEELRSYFVAHQGKKELKIHLDTPILHADFGSIAQQMAGKIQDNVKDPELGAWILPDFSTTTESDRAVAAILMMGAMQKYFAYGCCITCGIPSVTLLGERADWQKILKRLDKLSDFGDEPTTFAELLRPILHNFIATFDAKLKPNGSPQTQSKAPETTEPKRSRLRFWSKRPKSTVPIRSESNPAQTKTNEDVLDFWSKIANERNNGSGPDYLSGWITAFCMWDEHGKSLRGNMDEGYREFSLSLGGTTYHQVDLSEIPSGFTSVPVTIYDQALQYETRVVAGSLGIQATSSGVMTDPGSDHGVIRGDTLNPKYEPATGTEAPGLDSLQPLAGWVMYVRREGGGRE